MAATYLELAALRTDADFTSRCAVAVVLYADVVQRSAAAPAPEPPAIAPRASWALNALRNPAEQVFRIMGSLLADAVVQEKLGGITDAELSAAVAEALELQMGALS